MEFFDQTFLAIVAIGFAAQLIDGALGMAYGVSASSALIALGMPPAVVSANVHAAEVFTTAASGASHWRAGNIDSKLVRRLVPAGIAGAVFGTIVVSTIDTSIARPVIAAYLFYMGLVVLHRAIRGRVSLRVKQRIRLLGFAGGTVDTIGGGGWGPVVASRLLADGHDTVKTVGSVNLAEFFMTVAASVTFLFTLGPTFGKAALALLIGGVLAAPIAAYSVRRVPRRFLMGVVGLLICLVSAYNFVGAFR